MPEGFGWGSRVLLSVVVVCRNAEATIARTLHSILAQTSLPDEVIVVDGNSSDSTLRIATEMFLGKELRSVIVSEPDLGISDGFNKGIRFASGRWIHFLNADDWYFDSEVLEKALSVLQKTEAKIVCGSGWIEFELNRFMNVPSSLTGRGLKVGMTLVHPSMFARKSLYESVGGYSLSFRIAMDYEFLLRAEAFERKSQSKNFLEVTPQIVTTMSYGGASSLQRRRGYREVAAARLLHTDVMPARVVFDFLVTAFLFTTPLGKGIWQFLKPLRDQLLGVWRFTNASDKA